MTPYDAYMKYEAVKLHFTSDSYDYFKYHGKPRVRSQEDFLTRKDRIFFQMLAKRYTDQEDYVQFLVSNMMQSSNVWSKDLVSDSCREIHNRYKAHIQSLAYRFKDEMEQLVEWCEERGKSPDYLLKVEDGTAPLWKLWQGKSNSPIAISYETMIILDMIFDYMKRWDTHFNDTIIWPRTHRLMNKYRGFLNIEVTKYKKILRDIVNKT